MDPYEARGLPAGHAKAATGGPRAGWEGTFPVPVKAETGRLRLDDAIGEVRRDGAEVLRIERAEF